MNGVPLDGLDSVRTFMVIFALEKFVVWSSGQTAQRPRSLRKPQAPCHLPSRKSRSMDARIRPCLSRERRINTLLSIAYGKRQAPKTVRSEDPTSKAGGAL
jgi:hypothetical protein